MAFSFLEAIDRNAKPANRPEKIWDECDIVYSERKRVDLFTQMIYVTWLLATFVYSQVSPYRI